MSDYTYVATLLKRRPELEPCRFDINMSIEKLLDSIRRGGKILTCGNGGSASDAEHIVGELMKGFLLGRNLGPEEVAAFSRRFPETGSEMARNIQRAVPAIALTSNSAFITAYSNDVNHEFVFAQQVYGLGNTGDVVMCLSTSGNSKNVLNAAMVAKVRGVTVISLTGESGGLLKGHSDISIRVPSGVTHVIQEYHVAIYHAICAQIEESLFGNEIIDSRKIP